MTGFHAHLSVQYALLQITHDVLDDTIPSHTTAILAVDLTEAFDRIRHDAILWTLQMLQIGPKSYNCVDAFLSGLTASLHIDQRSTLPYTLGELGSPEGVVLATFIFNIALILLVLKYALHADDITTPDHSWV